MLICVEKIGPYDPNGPNEPKINGEFSGYYYSQR